MSEKKQRRSWTPDEKTEIVLAGLRGDRSVRDVCREHVISETQYYLQPTRGLGRRRLPGEHVRQNDRDCRYSFRGEHNNGEQQFMSELRRDREIRSDGELRVLQAIRSGGPHLFRTVEVIIEEGEVRTIRTTTNRTETEKLTDILSEHAFQKLVVTKRHGVVIAIEQQATQKISSNEPPARTKKGAPCDAD